MGHDCADGGGRAWGEEKLAGASLQNRQISDYVAGGPLVGLFDAPATVWTPHLGVSAMDSAGVLAGVERWFAASGAFPEEALFHFDPLVGARAQSPLESKCCARIRGTGTSPKNRPSTWCGF